MNVLLALTLELNTAELNALLAFRSPLLFTTFQDAFLLFAFLTGHLMTIVRTR